MQYEILEMLLLMIVQQVVQVQLLQQVRQAVQIQALIAVAIARLVLLLIVSRLHHQALCGQRCQEELHQTMEIQRIEVLVIKE